MHDGDVVIGDAQYGCAERMSTSDSVAMRVWPMACVPLKCQAILRRDLGRVAEILDQFERAAEGQHLRSFDLFDVRGKPPRVAGIAQAIAEGIGRGLGDLDRLGADLGEHPVDLGLPLPGSSGGIW